MIEFVTILCSTVVQSGCNEPSCFVFFANKRNRGRREREREREREGGRERERWGGGGGGVCECDHVIGVNSRGLN